MGDGAEEIGRNDGLEDGAGDAVFVQCLLVGKFAGRGEQHDRWWRLFAVFAIVDQAPSGFDAVHAGHHIVE